MAREEIGYGDRVELRHLGFTLTGVVCERDTPLDNDYVQLDRARFDEYLAGVGRYRLEGETMGAWARRGRWYIQNFKGLRKAGLWQERR